MKKFKIAYLVTAILSITLFGCEKDYEEHYRITYFPDFVVNGDAVVYNTFGESFTDPGVIATEAGEELPVTTVISGDFFGGTSFDANTTERYLFTYSAVNSDGYTGSVSRQVYNINTGDMVTNIEGMYTSTVVRNGSTGAQYTNMQYIVISKGSGGTYKLSDAIGGYYDIGRGYGADYRAQGMTVTANDIASNDFSFGSDIPVGAFGGSLTMVSMTVDAASKTITFTSDWDAGYTFVVTLTQVQL